MTETTHKCRVYSIKDIKAECFARPFFMLNDDMAMRAFIHTVTSADEAMSKFPEDYVLYRIGAWDDLDGAIEGCTPVSLMNGTQAFQIVQGKEVD